LSAAARAMEFKPSDNERMKLTFYVVCGLAVLALGLRL